ncbi:MAG: response regulator transcription factor [Rhodoferax sp.]
MKSVVNVWVTRDQVVLAHWQQALASRKPISSTPLEGLFSVPGNDVTLAWVDLAGLRPLPWEMPHWNTLIRNGNLRVIALSSNPQDDEAMQALDAGCVGYGHAFANAATLKQMASVVQSGQVWVGQSLMQRLLRTVGRVAPPVTTAAPEWQATLTPREIEIATLAANAVPNADIANRCKISERTVKAHLSAIFVKLNLTDRLQLALRVHGIS